MFSIVYTPLLLMLFAHLASLPPQSLASPNPAPDSFHLPIYQRRTPPRLRRRAGASASVGLGDYGDVAYSVLVDFGNKTQVPLVLDTGSSDVWVISDACTIASCTAHDIPRYPQASFKSSGLDARLFYGDSQTGTHAFGLIGKDVTGIGGLSIEDQYFAAINDTNTTISETGSSGIIGLGFPVNSAIWAELFRSQIGAGHAKRSDMQVNESPLSVGASTTTAGSNNTARDLSHSFDYRRTPFPDLASLFPSHTPSKRQSTTPAVTLTDLLNSFVTNGPLLARLAARGALSSPQFTVTLQRDTIQIGGNVGMLSLGDLPPGVANSSLTWVPLRGYTPKQGGIDSPTDQYPIAWEIPIDAVFLDGKRLPDSRLSPGVSVSALVDTGNSLVRGPRDVVQAMTAAVTGAPNASVFDCAAAHTLAFQIGGKMFPVDPRDFVQQAQQGDGHSCVSNVVATDPPHGGFLYSWSLGAPFLKSNLVSFYFGNLTHPSQDPPRMGFLSTVQSNAAEQLVIAASSAKDSGDFPSKTETAPANKPTVVTTISGVPQAPSQAAGLTSHDWGTKKNGAKRVAAQAVLSVVLSFVACVWIT